MSSFLLTRPSRGATGPDLTNPDDIFISTHTPLAGRDPVYASLSGVNTISTHTPLAGRDIETSVVLLFFSISTHTPLAGRDQEGIQRL